MYKMKKLMLLAVGVVLAHTATAQVVSSQTYHREKSKTMWYARLGVSFDNIAGANEYINLANDFGQGEETYSMGSSTGMDIDFGFQRPISNFGLYWGMELGVGTRGFSTKYTEIEEYDGEYIEKGKMLTWNVKYSPFTFGYKYTLTNDIKLDAHLGLFLSYDFAGKKINYSDSDGDKWELDTDYLKEHMDYQAFDAGMQLGLGVWFNRFNLDFTYQRGFVPMSKLYYSNLTGSVEKSLYSSNFMIRVGVAF